MNKVTCLNIRMAPEARPAWNFILQKGFFLRAQSGMTVRQFLAEVLGYENSFIDETVRTIFLNNSPVDDISSVHIKDEDKVSIGAAMPGLVGIVMGRDNPYKEFRSGIACNSNDGDLQPENEIRIFTKVFSVLVTKTGADILARGIEVGCDELREIVETNRDHLIAAEGLEDVLAGSEDKVRVVIEFA